MAITAATTDTTTTTASPGVTAGLLLVELAVIVYAITVIWKIFVKAGRPGWQAIIPFYNTYVQLKIVGRPGWWLLLYFIPLENIVISVIVAIDLAKSFGRSALFGFFGCFVFNIIGLSILAFGSDVYHGPSAGGGAASGTPVDPNNPVVAA